MGERLMVKNQSILFPHFLLPLTFSLLPKKFPFMNKIPLPIQGQQRVIIEHVTPQLEGGRFAIKAFMGDLIKVEADIFASADSQKKYLDDVTKKISEISKYIQIQGI